jgi:tetratricopeptide (TPR) repeat protein
MNRRLLEMLIATLALFGSALPAAAQYGTELPFVVGTGARSSGLGVAAVTLCDDPSVQYYNPSGLSGLQWKEFLFYRTTLFDSKSTYHALSYAHPLVNYGTLAVAVLRVDAGGIEERDESNQLLSTDLRNAQTRILLGYARNITGSLAAGLNVKIDNQSFGDYSATAVGMDIGFLATQRVPGNSFVKSIREGFAVRNVIEPSLKLDRDKVPDPMDIAFGVSAASVIGNVALVTSFDIVSPSESPLDFRFGQEVAYGNHFALRIGFDDVTPTYGLGARYKQFALDYAFRSQDIGDNHRISLGVRFGASVPEQRARARERLESEVDAKLTSRVMEMERAHTARALAEADSLYSAGNYSQAAERYETVLLWNSEHGGARTRLIDSRYRHALSLAEQAAADHNYVEAIHYSNQALSILPGDPAAAALAASCRDKLKAAENNKALLTKLLKTSIDLYAERRFVEALAGLEQILQLAPNSALAIEYADKCRVNIDGAVARQRADAESRARQGDYHGAIAALESALHYKPADPAILRDIDGYKKQRDEAMAASAEKLPASASPAPETASIDDKTFDEQYRKGMALFNAGNFDGAIRALLVVWTAQPDYHNVSDLLAKAYLFVGMEYYSENKHVEAIETWRKALNVDPDNEKARRYLSKAEEELQKLKGVSRAR